MKRERAAFAGEKRRLADEAIFEIFMREFSAYKSFCIYNSIASEADTKKIIAALSGMGKAVYLPRVDGENIVAAPLGELKKGAFGIEEPCGQALKGYADITVVPLLAVNSSGQRIGYGKGFYDRYLKDSPTLKVGLGYFFQMREFAAEARDVPLDLFICERGIYYFGEEG